MPFNMLVGLSNDVVDRRIEPAIGMHLVANVAARALRDKSGDFRVHLRRRFQAAEIGPEILENHRATMEGDPIAARVANYRREIMVAIMGSIGEERLLGRVIDQRGALGQTVEGALILGTDQTTGARFLYHLANPLKEGLVERGLVIGLHARIEGIKALLAQLAHTFVAIARRRTAPVEPYAIELILGDKLPDEIEFSFYECLLADAKLPHVRPISLVFGRRLRRV